MWVNETPLGADGKPNNTTWKLVYDFIDGQDGIEVIQPRDYKMGGSMDAEVRRSDTDSHEVYKGGLHVRPLGDGGTPPPQPTECQPGQHWDAGLGKCVDDVIVVPPPPPPPTNSSGIDQTKALNFIKNSYKQSVQMLEEAPGFNVFWLWNDQLLGQIALKHIDTAMASTIENKMNSFGVAMKTPWATLDPNTETISQ